MKNKVILLLLALVFGLPLWGQADRKDVRRGVRKYDRQEYREADVAFRKALLKDSTSLKAGYDLGANLYRQENYEEAAKTLEKFAPAAESSPMAADFHFNMGDVALARKDWSGAAEAFKQSLLLNPDDIEAKENYIYARKMMDSSQNGGDGDNSQDENGQKAGDGNDEGQDKDGQTPPGSDGNESSGDSGKSGQPVNITPQQAQQLLQAIQDKERRTQEKVDKEKAAAASVRRNEKNW